MLRFFVLKHLSDYLNAELPEHSSQLQVLFSTYHSIQLKSIFYITMGISNECKMLTILLPQYHPQQTEAMLRFFYYPILNPNKQSILMAFSP
jgi:hypothetical protein